MLIRNVISHGSCENHHYDMLHYGYRIFLAPPPTHTILYALIPPYKITYEHRFSDACFKTFKNNVLGITDCAFFS